MPRRHLLTERQRASLFDLPTDDASLLRHYTLADDDLEHIKKRRRTENKLGFALHLCALRYPGRTLIPGEVIPEEVISFIGAQLGIPADKLATLCYATRRQTHQEHMDALRALYDYNIFSGHIALSLREWLTKEAEVAQSSENLVRRFVEKCRCERVILPAVSTIERLCADKLIAAEKRMEKTITGQLSEENKEKLNALLVEKTDDSISRFIWLRHHDAGSNSAEANRLLDRLEFLQNLGVSPCTVLNIPPHWVTRFRRQGERYFTDGLQDIKGDRKFAILAVCVVEWQAAIADSIVETHDRIVGRTWNEAKKSCGAHMEESRPVARDTLKAFLNLGKSLIHARDSCESLDEAVLDSASGWDGLRRLVSQAEHLTDALEADPMAYVVQGYYRFRLYVPRMLSLLDIQYSPSASALIEAVTVLKKRQQNKYRPTSFLRPTSKWHRHLKTYSSKDSRLWEVSVFFHLREAFRSGDIWLKTSRRYSNLTEVLVPATTVTTAHQLAVPLDPRTWLADRKAEMINGLKRLAKAARTDCIPNGSIENGSLSLTRLEAKPPEGAEDLTLDLYRCLPEVRITDILLDVDGMLGFTDSFTHLRTGSPCTDKIGLLNVLLAEGLNLGLRKMAEASDTHDYWQLSRLARWHIEEEALNRALAKVVEAQSRLAISRTWGAGLSASSDGQFFQTTRQ